MGTENKQIANHCLEATLDSAPQAHVQSKNVDVEDSEQMPLQFEWDAVKAHTNEEKHGISFDEASTAFEDVLSVTILDPLHSEDEDRFVLIGYSYRGRLLVVVHTDREDRIRIISARIATRKERERHENNVQ